MKMLMLWLYCSAHDVSIATSICANQRYQRWQTGARIRD